MIRIIFGLLLIFFIPGFFAINALFPRKKELDEEYDMLYRVTLGIGLSITITILNGFFLGNPSMKAFTSTNIWISLGMISAILFFIGWFRGAYCSLAKIGLARMPPSFEAWQKTTNPPTLEKWWLDYDKEKNGEKIKKYKEKLSKIEAKEKKRYYFPKRYGTFLPSLLQRFLQLLYHLMKRYYKSRIERLRKELEELSPK